jgi:hypothetical protein
MPVTAALAQGTQGAQGTSRAETQGQRQATPGRLIVPVTATRGTATETTAAAPLTGTLAVQRFARTDTGVAAVGTLTLSVTDPATNAARTIVTQVAMPLARQGSSTAATDTPVGQAPSIVAASATTCGTLNLALGPVDVEVLGLTLQVQRVAVDVSAAQGAGDQLGNLLCQIAGLLDNETAPAPLVTALNRLLDLLG